MLNQKPHTHHCPHCDNEKECGAANTGGCLFASTADMTCEDCAQGALLRRLRDMNLSQERI